MTYDDKPLGMIQYDDLLNALVAFYQLRANDASFCEALDCVARLCGLTDYFEAEKAELLGAHIVNLMLIEGE